MLQRINSRALPNGFWDIKDWNDFVWIFMNQGKKRSPPCAMSCVDGMHIRYSLSSVKEI